MTTTMVTVIKYGMKWLDVLTSVPPLKPPEDIDLLPTACPAPALLPPLSAKKTDIHTELLWLQAFAI